MKKAQSKTTRPKSQIETDKYVLDFLGDIKVEKPTDLLKLRSHIINSLEFREYKEQTKKNENNIRWKRTASQIIQDGYVYKGKECSDLSIVFLALCKALGISGCLIKVANFTEPNTHSLTEINLHDKWYRFDPSTPKSIPREGRLTNDNFINKDWKIWKRGRDLWDLGLDNMEKERIIYNQR
jgi:hypothetical protein